MLGEHASPCCWSLFHFTFSRGRRPLLFCLYRLVSQFISLAYDLRASVKQLAIRELCRRGPESDDAGGGFFLTTLLE